MDTIYDNVRVNDFETLRSKLGILTDALNRLEQRVAALERKLGG
jgi:hypothetical protein